MAKYALELIRTDNYEIEVDKTIWNKDELKKWSETFTPARTTQAIAESLAFQVMRFGSQQFYEGFGYVKTVRKDGYLLTQFDGSLKKVEEEEFAKGITLTLITEDDDIDIDCRKI